MNKLQRKKLGEILCKYNDKTISEKESMRQIMKLFPRIFIRSWREYNPIKEN